MINWNNSKPLSTEEMNTTARAAINGDASAIEKLVTSNIKFASSLAHKYKDFDGLHVEDLTMEAIEGLIVAIKDFDPDKGTKFTTHAAWRMKAYVLRHVIDNFRLVKIGTTKAQRKLFWRLNREVEALQDEGIDADDHAIADRLEVKVKEVREMKLRMHTPESSLDATSTDNDSGRSLFDVTPNGQPDPEQYTTDKRMVAWVQARMVEFEQRLEGKDLVVWNYRIASEHPETMEQVSARIGTTKQYVSLRQKHLEAAFTKYARNCERG